MNFLCLQLYTGYFYLIGILHYIQEYIIYLTAASIMVPGNWAVPGGKSMISGILLADYPKCIAHKKVHACSDAWCLKITLNNISLFHDREPISTCTYNLSSCGRVKPSRHIILTLGWLVQFPWSNLLQLSTKWGRHRYQRLWFDVTKISGLLISKWAEQKESTHNSLKIMAGLKPKVPWTIQ